MDVRMFSSLAVAFVCVAALAAERPWLVVNEDNDHYFKQDASLMTEAGLVAYVDGIAQGHVTHFFMCVNGQRTSYASKTWEPIWTNLDTDRALQPTGPNHTRDVWAVNAKRLFDAGIDPYAVWTRRCREKGVSPWISMRMNDVHFSEITNFFRNTTFCRTRRDLWRVPDAPDGDETWAKYALDYAHPEVREYNLAQFREIAERWDADGVEFDWMRFGEHLKPGREVEDAHFLTEFMRAARRIADEVSAKRGRKLQIAVRVPRSPELAMRTGFRVDDWVKEGLVDLVIGHSFLNADFDLPVDAWQKFLAERDPKVRFLPGIDIVAKPADRKLKTKPVYMTMAHYRGIADNFYRRGARGLYLFNAPYLPKVFAEICREGLAPAAVAVGERQYAETQPDFPPDYGSGEPKRR